MIEDLLKNELSKRYLPLVAGLVFVLLFISLGLWQLDRASGEVINTEECSAQAG